MNTDYSLRAGVVCLALVVSAAAPADECVNPGGTGGCHASVQAAIDAASPGDTVTVEAGLYNERIRVTKSLLLLGARSGVDPTPDGARADTAAESVIDIAGLPLVNPNVAIEIQSGVSDVTWDGFTLVGSPIIHWADEVVLRAWDDNIVVRNNIIDGYVGFLYKGTGHIEAVANRFTVNKNGVVVQVGAADIAIDGNTFEPGTSPASDPAAVQMTAVYGGSVSGNAASGFTGGRGMGGSNFHDLLISSNTFTGFNDGISIWGGSDFITIEYNVLRDHDRHGINVKGADLAIQCNEITGNGANGVNIARHVIDTERVAVTYNHIAGNVDYGLFVDTSGVTETVDGTENWWGDASGPANASNPGGAGDPVSDGAAFDPWRSGPVDIGRCPMATVRIDLRPYQADNQVNTAGRMMVPVAILGDEGFDPCAEVDLESVVLRGAPALGTRFECEDTDGDGWDDFILYFRGRRIDDPTQEECDDPEATIRLEGATWDDALFEGTDFVRWIGPACKG